MGERKGVNKYYPPDYDPKKGGLNKWQGTHALRERARKLDKGILIIRFEMPYNIWCEGCEKHIGTGVRYNAEKTKVGMYYTTPIYQFRMKCAMCPNHFEIKTDPGNLDYVIVSGARRQERRWDMVENEQIAPEDKSVGRQMATDAMFKLEHGAVDAGKANSVAPNLNRLEVFQDRTYDQYAANRCLRDIFRSQKAEIKEKSQMDAELLRKSSLNIQLKDEDSGDVKTAQLLQLYSKDSYEEREKKQREEIGAESWFSEKTSPTGAAKNLLKLITTKSGNHHKPCSKINNIVIKHKNKKSQSESSTVSSDSNITCSARNIDLSTSLDKGSTSCSATSQVVTSQSDTDKSSNLEENELNVGGPEISCQSKSKGAISSPNLDQRSEKPMLGSLVSGIYDSTSGEDSA